jgi:hypothetical protein
MLNAIRSKGDLIPFFTDTLLENEVGVIISEAMPRDSYIAVDIDTYYHKAGPHPTPAIADILLAARRLSHKDQFHIYVVEMKNIKTPKGFKTKNIYEKFKTAVDDFMKTRYKDIFLDTKFKVEKFELFFITDAYQLKRRGFTENTIKSFLSIPKIAMLQSMQPFIYRHFKAMIQYRMPNPMLEWK